MPWPGIWTLALGAALLCAAVAPGAGKPQRETPTGEPRRIVVSVSGDLLIHSPVWEAAARAGGGSYDFAALFRRVRRYVARADLALCHVEVPMGAGPPQGYPTFNSPPALARGVASTGWDACSTASNHTLDQGMHGVRTTLRALNAADVRHAGSYKSAAKARRPMIIGAGGVKVALLSYTTDLNGLSPPAPWVVNVLRSANQVRRDAKRAVRKGARAVIVNVHWASQIKPEYTPGPSTAQLRLARRIAKINRVTALVGQGPHVVQPVKRLEGKLVVLGEGNLISNQTAACCAAASQDGLIALLHIRVGRSGAKVERIRYVPVWVRHPDYRVLPVGRAYRKGWAGRDALAASWHRTVNVAGKGRGVRPMPSRLAR